jgi:hypothetical protein
MKTKLLCTALCALAFAASAQAADFATAEGYQAACAAMEQLHATPDSLTDDDQRVAYVVCNDTTLMQQVATWATRKSDRAGNAQFSDRKFIDEVQVEIDYAIRRLANSRTVLEKINLGKRKSLRLMPSQWQLDLNGDGKIDIWEKYFFAIPRRTEQPVTFHMPNIDEAYYRKQYNLDAAIKADQSDVLWALSYHDFIESLLTTVRAYDFDEQFRITLKRPELVRRGHELLNQGLANSERMRRSVLAETGNDEEWIANPKQTDSVFPLTLTTDNFSAWGKLIKDLQDVVNGKTLLAPSPASGENLGLCDKGFGLDLRELALNPPRSFMDHDMAQAQRFKLEPPYCRKVDKAHPASSLLDLAARAAKDDPQWRFLRYLFWVN